MSHRIEITCDRLRNTIVLDGRDISDLVVAFGVTAEAGTQPEVNLVLSNMDVAVAGDFEDINVVEQR